MKFEIPEGQKWIELGGGANPVIRPNVDVRGCTDAAGNQMVDFTADFDKPLPITTEEFDGVICKFVIEHLSWRCVRQFIEELCRILKPGGTAIVITADVNQQLKWINSNPEGWDNKPFFESASCILFGDQDYPENTHKNYMDKETISNLFQEAGFSVMVSPYGDRETDLLLQATKNQPTIAEASVTTEPKEEPKEVNMSDKTMQTEKENLETIKDQATHELYDVNYFNGGGKFGGYAGEGYWDYPVHHITAQHIIDKKPESVLELGCARGYVLKKVIDALGIQGMGLEVSRHCWLTRACHEVTEWNMLASLDWPINKQLDLCYSVATLEHVPEKCIDTLLDRIGKHSKRGLHGIDFGEKDNGFDKTHVLLRPENWWRKKFDEHGLQSHEIVNKEYLETGVIAPQILHGDTKVKLNIGCAWTMFYFGWTNTDVIDQSQFANHYRFKFEQMDVTQGLPNYATESVDMIFCCHMLEHLTYDQGRSFLQECRRVLKPDGCMRLIVPDAPGIMESYNRGWINGFDQVSATCLNAKTGMEKLYSLLCENHKSVYGHSDLCSILDDCGFDPKVAAFRTTSVKGVEQILKETIDMHPSLSLYVDAIPKV